MSVEIIVDDVFAGLSRLKDNSVNCVVTSPPYWGLRDYGFKGQIGLEPTFSEHVETILAVFREVRRVLKPDGTVWFNYGDRYAIKAIEGLAKVKDLIMMPNRLAIALQDDGWWIRSEIVWAKPNAMPDSASDRPSVAHEKIFMLSKSSKYWYDAAAVKMPGRTSSGNKSVGGWAAGDTPHTAIAHNQGVRGRDTYGRHTLKDAIPSEERRVKRRASTPRHEGTIQHTKLDETPRGQGRNLRNYEPQVWQVATAPFKAAHFATFPVELVVPCIKAGCPKDGVVLDPFGGSGTVGLVADRLQRNAILIEANQDYAEIARARINQDCTLFPSVDGSS